MSSSQLAALDTSQLEAFSTAQIVAIDTQDMAALREEQLANLSSTQTAALSTAQLNALTSAQILTLPTDQVQALTTGQIANLPEYMQRVKSDVAKFNLHVEDLVAQLAARGLTSNELLINLFRAYQMCEDEVFKRYIEAKENQYGDGLSMTETELMQVALTKYQTRVDGGKWQALSAEQEKIVALEARLKRQEQQINQKGNQKKLLVKD